MKKVMISFFISLAALAALVTSFFVHDFPVYYHWASEYEQYEDRLDWEKKQQKQLRKQNHAQPYEAQQNGQYHEKDRDGHDKKR